MASIRIISKSSVSAATNKKSNDRIDLTPWDLRSLLRYYTQKGFLFHKPNPLHEKQWENTLIHHLKTSLSHTLDLFPLLAGRFATTDHDDGNISFFIDCNNAGVDFVHAAADGVSVADILDPTYIPDLIDSFFQLNGARNFEATTKPLVAVQVTELKDGIFIGCSTNHSVLDGSSFWHFLSSWSQICRGSDSLSNPPVLQRWFPRNVDYPIRFPMFKKEQLFDSLVRPPVQQRIFHFSRESMTKLKAKANAEIGTNRISSLQALMAHLWRSAVRNQCLDPDQEVNCFIPIGARPRLQPPLPQEYFGNAVQTGTVTMKARELLEQGIGRVALEINKMIGTYTDEKVRNYLETWIRNPSVVGLRTSDANLMMSHSPRFDVYGNDFGWGNPIAVRSGPLNKRIGKMTFFAGIERGSVDIETRLSPETMQAIESDAEFMDAVTTT